MIMLWFGFWLYHDLGGSFDCWWQFPFFLTFFFLVVAECVSYVFFGIAWDIKRSYRSERETAND